MRVGDEVALMAHEQLVHAGAVVPGRVAEEHVQPRGDEDPEVPGAALLFAWCEHAGGVRAEIEATQAHPPPWRRRAAEGARPTPRASRKPTARARLCPAHKCPRADGAIVSASGPDPASPRSIGSSAGSPMKQGGSVRSGSDPWARTSAGSRAHHGGDGAPLGHLAHVLAEAHELGEPVLLDLDRD